MPKKNIGNQKCGKCGMTVCAGDYHPDAACLMFLGCGDAEKVSRALMELCRDNVVAGRELQKAEDSYPPKLRGPDTQNFDTLMCAASAGDLCLLSATRKTTGEPVALCCAVNHEAKGVSLVPLAVMVEGNPFEAFSPPSVKPPSTKKKSIRRVKDGPSKE